MSYCGIHILQVCFTDIGTMSYNQVSGATGVGGGVGVGGARVLVYTHVFPAVHGFKIGHQDSTVKCIQIIIRRLFFLRRNDLVQVKTLTLNQKLWHIYKYNIDAQNWKKP